MVLTRSQETFEEFPWESKYQYTCRTDKIREHTPHLGELRATALANVWANYHFLACSYPLPVLEAIKHWAPPPKDTKYEETLSKVRELEKQSEFDATWVNLDLDVKKLEMRLLEDFNNAQQPAICMLCNSAQKFKKPIEFVEVERDLKSKNPSFRVSLFLNHIRVSDGVAPSFKEAKRACAENSIKFLKKRGMLMFSPNNVDESAVEKVSKDSLIENAKPQKIEEDNIGNKLLKAMGWTGDTGLGKTGQGIKDPISSQGQTNRGGLGSYNSEYGICKQNVQEQLLVFLRNRDVEKLEFGAELDNTERKLIHQLSEKYGLKHKSRGKGSNRFLTVWKEPTVAANVTCTFDLLPDFGDEEDPMVETEDGAAEPMEMEQVTRLRHNASKMKHKQPQQQQQPSKKEIKGDYWAPQNTSGKKQKLLSEDGEPQFPVENVGIVSKECLSTALTEKFEPFKISEDNVGNQLLRSMGWSDGDGLGKTSQGRVDPVSIDDGQLSRRGFGSGANNSKIKKVERAAKPSKKNKIYSNNVRDQLSAFIDNPNLLKLEFPSDFCSHERKMVKLVARELNQRFAANLHVWVKKEKLSKKKKEYTLKVWKSDTAAPDDDPGQDDSSDDELSDTSSSGKRKREMYSDESANPPHKQAIPFNYRTTNQQQSNSRHKQQQRPKNSDPRKQQSNQEQRPQFNQHQKPPSSQQRGGSQNNRDPRPAPTPRDPRPAPTPRDPRPAPTPRDPRQAPRSEYSQYQDPYLTHPDSRNRTHFNQGRSNNRGREFYDGNMSRVPRTGDPSVDFVDRRQNLRDQFNNYNPQNRTGDPRIDFRDGRDDLRTGDPSVDFIDHRREHFRAQSNGYNLPDGGYDRQIGRDPRLANYQSGTRASYRRPNYR